MTHISNVNYREDKIINIFSKKSAKYVKSVL